MGSLCACPSRNSNNIGMVINECDRDVRRKVCIPFGVIIIMAIVIAIIAEEIPMPIVIAISESSIEYSIGSESGSSTSSSSAALTMGMWVATLGIWNCVECCRVKKAGYLISAGYHKSYIILGLVFFVMWWNAIRAKFYDATVMPMLVLNHFINITPFYSIAFAFDNGHTNRSKKCICCSLKYWFIYFPPIYVILWTITGFINFIEVILFNPDDFTWEHVQIIISSTLYIQFYFKLFTYCILPIISFILFVTQLKYTQALVRLLTLEYVRDALNEDIYKKHVAALKIKIWKNVFYFVFIFIISASSIYILIEFMIYRISTDALSYKVFEQGMWSDDALSDIFGGLCLLAVLCLLTMAMWAERAKFKPAKQYLTCYVCETLYESGKGCSVCDVYSQNVIMNGGLAEMIAPKINYSHINILKKKQKQEAKEAQSANSDHSLKIELVAQDFGSKSISNPNQIETASWSCRACTFDNKMNHQACAMCGEPKIEVPNIPQISISPTFVNINNQKTCRIQPQLMSYGEAQTNSNIIMHQRPSPPQYMDPSMHTFANTSNQPLLRSKAMTGYGSNNEPQPAQTPPQYIYNNNA